MSAPQPKEGTLSQAGGRLQRIRCEDISEIGAYVAVESGDLIRVPATCRAEDETKQVGEESGEPRFVVKISGNPFIPISEARLTAASLDIEISF